MSFFIIVFKFKEFLHLIKYIIMIVHTVVFDRCPTSVLQIPAAGSQIVNTQRDPGYDIDKYEKKKTEDVDHMRNDVIG